MSIVDHIAQRIYNTHWKPPSPPWENASRSVQDWVRAQAREAIEGYENPPGSHRPHHTSISITR